MRIKITLFFTLLFSISLITPTVISLVDDCQNIAFFLDISEEEENNGKEGKESAKDLEIKIQPAENSKILLQKGILKKKNVRFKSKNYISEYPKNTTPPPEVFILIPIII